MDPLRFVPVANALAAMSKDPSQKIGAVAIDSDGNVLSVGFNGFPRGVDDTCERLADRTTKLRLISHAEANVIAQAARVGAPLLGATLLVTRLYPCAGCAKLIVQAGISRVLAPRMNARGSNPQWAIERETSEIIFEEAGVEVVHYDGIDEP